MLVLLVYILLPKLVVDFPGYVRQQLVRSLIFPTFEYAAGALSDLRGEDLDKLHRAQNAAVRFILRLKIYTPAYKKLGIGTQNSRAEKTTKSCNVI